MLNNKNYLKNISKNLLGDTNEEDFTCSNTSNGV
jgi:hypothetical protein